MMLFGLRNSDNTYQCYIDEVTRNLPFCFTYVDDVLVASHSMEEHECHLCTLFGPYYKSILEQDVELKLGSDTKMIF